MNGQGTERRASPRFVVAATVIVDGCSYQVVNFSAGGLAVAGHLWFEEDVRVSLEVSLGQHRYTLWRTVRSCYLDVRHNVSGFEFVEQTAEENDILLGLVLSTASGAPMPLTVGGANCAALASLEASGEAECPAGGWRAKAA